MKQEDEEFQEGVFHRIHQCQGQIVVQEVHDGITTNVIKRCPYRGELTKVKKKLLCHSCREEAIEKSKSEKERNKK